MTVSMTHAIPRPAAVDSVDERSILQGLERVIDTQIGPRGVGAIYENVDGAFEVIAVVRDHDLAKGLLKRRCAQWALIVKDVLRVDAEPFPVGSVWTTNDVLVRDALTEVR
ncbi:hypothetical protein ACIBL6_47705 [Streptomyces sp. NPDC050400]|uniref:hypothetical protein n=1 Tax=Streptomyces sp. NPDC050400 TaxID=3365610 RepID=UPI0037908342